MVEPSKTIYLPPRLEPHEYTRLVGRKFNIIPYENHIHPMMQNEDSPEDIENTVKYEVYLSKPASDSTIDEYIKHVAAAVHDTIDCQNSRFNLRKRRKGCMLSGSVKFDQNIEEEWLIVYMLFQLSRYDPDVVIRVYDNDGDLLLIEAAEHLPLWLESSKSKNRVFIHKGKLHIIPEQINLKDLLSCHKSQDVTITQVAAKFVRDTNAIGAEPASKNCESNSAASHSTQLITGSAKVITQASQAIQDAIKEQLSGMPDKKAWLSKKLRQLDEIISDNSGEETRQLEEKFKESLSLASVMAMMDEDLQISPISSAPTSSNTSVALSSSSSSSSSSWLSEQQDD